MSDRRDEIMNVAEHMIRSQGYNGFSFRDVAAKIGVKSASIHYHFPTKANLAAAVAKRYRERFDALYSERLSSGEDPLSIWKNLFRVALNEDGLMCLCGILAVEGSDLPEEVASEARQFLEMGITSIAKLDNLTESDGARILAQLEGAMLLARSLGNPSVFDQATAKLVTE